MLLTITHLKAPWPAGAQAGDVVDMPSVPAWALGKCEPAPEGAAVTALVQDQGAGTALEGPDGATPATAPKRRKA